MDKLMEILKGSAENIFFPGATEEEIVKLESELKTTLPPSYRQFLLESNGALLYGQDEILGTVDDPAAGRQSVSSLKVVLQSGDRLPSGLIPFHRGALMHCFDPSHKSPDGEYPVVGLTFEGRALLDDSYPSFAVFLKIYIITFNQEF